MCDYWWTRDPQPPPLPPHTHPHTPTPTHTHTGIHTQIYTCSTPPPEHLLDDTIYTSDIPNASNASGTSLATAVRKDSGLGVSASYRDIHAGQMHAEQRGGEVFFTIMTHWRCFHILFRSHNLLHARWLPATSSLQNRFACASHRIASRRTCMDLGVLLCPLYPNHGS